MRSWDECKPILLAELQKPIIKQDGDAANSAYFDPWVLFEPFPGSYSAAQDVCMIDALARILRREYMTQRENEEAYEFAACLFCMAGLCHYGSNPFFCFAHDDDLALRFYGKWRMHYERFWGEPIR